MRYRFILFLLLTGFTGIAQSNPSKWVRAFPITSYIVTLNDSVQLVQIELPDDLKIAEKELGLIRGVYGDSKADTVQKGFGRCQLIKGNFYYFAIGSNSSGVALKAGDLLYTQIEQSSVYKGMIPQLAAHFIRLQDVQESSFYDRFEVFRYWTKEKKNW